jgi:hypothetical protein
MKCGLAAPKAAPVNSARPNSMKDTKRSMLAAYASRSPQNKGRRHTDRNIVPNRESVGIAICAKTNPPLSFRSQVYRREICLLPAEKSADSSRDKTALRNDNFWRIFITV